MEIFNLICQFLTVGLCFFALYMCRDYSKMLDRSRDRFAKAYELVEKYRELYELEKKRNEKP